MSSVKVSDYIADFLVNNGIRDVFTVTGGGSMHLNDSFGHHSQLHCTYNHNEQASAMAAEAYARINNNIAAVCATTGPGATNLITGVAGGYMDSISMLVFSGQARYATTVYASGLNLRTRGIQEFDIIGSVKNMTKYCELVSDPKKIRYCLEKALYLAKEGRPGPCWLDIPLDVQAAMVDPDELEGFDFPNEKYDNIPSGIIDEIVDRIKQAARPVLVVGNGVRLAGAHQKFLSLVEKLNIPIVTTLSSVDAIAFDHPLYVGKMGMMGDRAGNFAVQNSDLLLSLGSRLAFPQTGFNYQTWARGAFKIINDIDANELEKDSIKPDIKLPCDVSILIDKMLDGLEQNIESKKEWIEQCKTWKNKYPVVLPEYYNNDKPHLYPFFKILTNKMNKDSNLVVSVGSSRVVGSQASEIKEGMRFITNVPCASMGYDLPAAIGVHIADKSRKTVLVTGDGSIQMNLQELQTIVQNELPISIFVVNNNGYHTCIQTQKGFFGEPLVGVGPLSSDLSFPNFQQLANAYGISYLNCSSMQQLDEVIQKCLLMNKPCICEVYTCDYIVAPRTATKMFDDGTLLSTTLENLKPFLSDEEINSNMYIERFKIGDKYI